MQIESKRVKFEEAIIKRIKETSWKIIKEIKINGNRAEQETYFLELRQRLESDIRYGIHPKICSGDYKNDTFFALQWNPSIPSFQEGHMALWLRCYPNF